MKCEIRRKEIIELLSSSDRPVPAAALAEKFGVSRQIIVKDIAKLREEGMDIAPLSRGYVLEGKNPYERVFKVFHSDEDVERELNLIVDLGGVIEDVFINHKVYGIVKARMDIKTRHDIQIFLKNLAAGKSSLLKNVTAGYHYHTVTANDAETIERIAESLDRSGFLAPLREYEPDKIAKNTCGS
ncbi:MAG: transcription repressor NadR [Clostridia bacterium]|nr:transcription repressor NadR [Clostridia bacterium]